MLFLISSEAWSGACVSSTYFGYLGAFRYLHFLPVLQFPSCWSSVVFCLSNCPCQWGTSSVWILAASPPLKVLALLRIRTDWGPLEDTLRSHAAEEGCFPAFLLEYEILCHGAGWGHLPSQANSKDMDVWWFLILLMSFWDKLGVLYELAPHIYLLYPHQESSL